jgi:hypothetical protein
MFNMGPLAGNDEGTYTSELDLAPAMMEFGLLALLARHVPAGHDDDLEAEGLQYLAGAPDGALVDGGAARHGLVGGGDASAGEGVGRQRVGACDPQGGRCLDMDAPQDGLAVSARQGGGDGGEPLVACPPCGVRGVGARRHWRMPRAVPGARGVSRLG